MRRVPRPSMLAFALLGAACRASGPADTGAAMSVLEAPDLGTVVARVGGLPIHAAEVAAQARRTGVPPREALDQLVTVHLLAERARQRGIRASEPPAAALLVQRLLERQFEGRTRREDIPEQDLRRAYDQVRSHYVRPRMVEVGLLSVYTGPGMKPEPRARAQATARLLAQHLARNPPRTIEAFAAVASTPPWSERKVRYWRFWQGPSREHGPFGGTVPGAIHRLKQPGDRSGLIEDDSGYHFAWFLAEEPPRNVPFEAAREEVREKYYPTWRQQKFLELAQQAAASHQVEVYPDRLFAKPGS